jgi:hypothetical protein
MPVQPRSALRSLRAGTPVEVATHFTGSWTGGFEVIGLDPNGCRVRRLSDGAVIPNDFDLSEVRPAGQVAARRQEGEMR